MPRIRYVDVERALERITVLDRQRLKPEVAAELGPIRAYLDAHPEDVDRVHADIHARGLADRFPWRKLNAGTARDLAVLHCFTPYLDTSALVAARRLRLRGIVTDVISQQLDDSRRLDPTSEKVAREYVDHTRVLPGESGFASWPATRAFVEGVLAEVTSLQATKGPYRTLYTRAMAPQSHFAGALLKIRFPQLRWTAEFSDPLRINAYGETRVADVEDDWLVAELRAAVVAAGFADPTTRRLFTWAEIVAYALADEVVFTNDHQRAFMLDYCADRDLAAHVETITTVSHQPTLPASFYQLAKTIYPLADDVVNVGYFGLFFGTRGLGEVLDAVEQLTEDERARLRLHVFTDKPPKLVAEVRTRGLDDVVSVRPYVPFLKFLNLTTRFDLLMVNDAVTADLFACNPYLPSKISDYRGSGTPIWSIYEPGSVLSGLSTDYASELGDVAGAARVLRAALVDLA